MGFFELISGRHSVRRYADKPIEQEKISQILKAGLNAPSSKNSHSTGFLIVEDRAMLERISGMRDFGSSFLRFAPMAIAVMGDERLTDLWVDNAAIAATYLQLAAEDLGLSTCWVHVNGRPQKKDDPTAGTAGDYLAEFLPIPEGHKVLCFIAVGYAEKNKEPRELKDDPSRVFRA